MTRSTSNRNARGGSDARRRRREWLVKTFRADVDVLVDVTLAEDPLTSGALQIPTPGAVTPVPLGEGVPACRCYRCGGLLTVDTVTADRIRPGCLGGTYRRENLRPACLFDNSSTGGKLGASRRAEA